MAAQYTLPQWINDLSEEYAIKLLLLGFFGTSGPSSGGGGGITTNGLTDAQLRAAAVPVSPSSYPSGTLTVRAKAAGETENIPVGAFQIGVIFNTGTGTINGVAWPTGLPFNIEARTAAAIAVVCGSPGTASINYLT